MSFLQVIKYKLMKKYINIYSNIGEEIIMDNIVVVRGGGDLATGVIHKLHRCNIKVVVLECEHPTAIRRTVSFCNAVFENEMVVEGVKCRLAYNIEEIYQILEDGDIPLIIDEKCKIIKDIKPVAVIDAIIAKKNIGTSIDMAPITIALGPGFEAGKDVHAVIETKRGHNLGRIIYEGFAAKNTGIPGEIKGYSKERVIHSPCEGIINNISEIGDYVEQNQIIATVGNENVYASLSGILRGIIYDKTYVKKGLKIADIDPRKEELQNCYKISDKARCIAGGTLEALLNMCSTKNIKIF